MTLRRKLRLKYRWKRSPCRRALERKRYGSAAARRGTKDSAREREPLGSYMMGRCVTERNTNLEPVRPVAAATKWDGYDTGKADPNACLMATKSFSDHTTCHA
jgi:hypothetical protein